MILAAVIAAALIGASVGGYVLISKLLREEIKPGITADEAIQILLDNIITIKPDELNYDLIAFMWPELLNPGDTITPHNVPEHTYTMEDNTWFFWVNDFPQALFSHPTRYVFIDASTGDYTVAVEGWWPQLNGVDLWGTPEEYWDENYWVYSTYVENSSTLTSFGSFSLAGSGGASGNPSGGSALIIEGPNGPASDIKKSADGWALMIQRTFGVPFDNLTYLHGDNAYSPYTSTENNIGNVMDNLGKKLKPCDDLSIYITGHGRENDGAVEMMGGFMLTPEQFSEWICRIENGVHISVVVAACYSGKWIDALKKWDNKVEIIYTSTDNDSVGWGDVDDTTFEKYKDAVQNGDADPDPNPNDEGLEAISGLIEDFENLIGRYNRGEISRIKLWQEAIKSAKEKDASYQNSEFFKKWTENNLPAMYPPCSGKGVANPQEWKSPKVVDYTPPKVVSTSPQNGQVNVPLNTTIIVTFSEAMNKISTQQSFSIYPSTDGGFGWVGNTIIFTPSEELLPETLYEVTISTEAMDQAGNRLEENYIWSFLTRRAPLEVRSLSISAGSPVTAGGTSSITVRAYDNEGMPVSGANIALYALAMDGEYGGDYKVELAVTDRGDGTYTSSLTSAWAGVYSLRASVRRTDIKTSGAVTFVPGPVAMVVASFTRPWAASIYLTSTITFYFADAHGNAVPPGQVEPLVETSFGHLGEVHTNPNNTFSMSLSSMDWGVAEVTIIDNLSKVPGRLKLEFPPIHLETEMDLTPEINLLSPENLEMEVTWPENVAPVRVSLFVPLERGELNEYQMTIQYDNSILHLENVLDADPDDNFPAPWVEVLSGNSFKVGQKGSPPESFFDVFVMNFTGLAPGSGELSITNVRLAQDNVPISIPTVVENKRENIKVLKRVIMPLKFWIVENSGQTDADARREAKEAETTLNKAAKDCKLDYQFVVIAEINHIRRGTWDNIVGADNVLVDNEWLRLENYRFSPGVSVEGYKKWINVFLVPPCTLKDNAIGWWDPRNGSIASDQSKDRHNRNLAHELIHELSKSRIKDSPAANAAAQGGRDPNNIMRYCGGGREISSEQGKILNEEIGKRLVGDVYRPGL